MHSSLNSYLKVSQPSTSESHHPQPHNTSFPLQRQSLVFITADAGFSGQEQDFGDGAADPYNRQALWPSNYTNTSTYHHIASLNQIRHTLISNGTQFEGKSFLDYQSKIVASSQYDVAIRKGPLLAVLTNVSLSTASLILAYLKHCAEMSKAWFTATRRFVWYNPFRLAITIKCR